MASGLNKKKNTTKPNGNDDNDGLMKLKKENEKWRKLYFIYNG